MPATNSPPLLTLPRIAQSQLDVRLIYWGFAGAEPRRFLNPGELEVLVALVRSVNPRHVVEFGCHEGRTASGLLCNVPSIETYLGIDVEPGYVPKCEVQRREIPRAPGRLLAADERFSLLLRPRGSFDVTAEELGAVCVVFIDGDHSAEAVARDSELAFSVVRPGGIVIWHDYHDLETVEVRPVVEQLARDGHNILAVENTWIAFKRC